MRRMLLKSISIAFMTIIMILNNKIVLAESYDSESPKLVISAPNTSTIKEGGTITYTVDVKDNIGVTAVSIRNSDITTNGFTASITVKKISAFTRTITFSNIKNNTISNSNKYFVIGNGVAMDAFGNYSVATSSPKFSIKKEIVVQKPTQEKPVEKPTQKPTKPVTTIKTDTTLPTVKISKANPVSIKEGGKISFVLTFSDNKGIRSVSLKEKDIKLNGFEADIEIIGSGNKSRTITLNNIKGTKGTQKSITIASGVVIDTTGNRSKAVTSSKFTLETIVEEILNPNIEITKPITDLSIIGEINKDIKGFSAWLRSEKTNVSFIQENNYVSEKTKTTYIVEYYNGSEESVKNVKMQLNIPQNIDIEEISEGGKIVKSEQEQTIIEWDLENLTPLSGGRLIVKLKFKENKTLKDSKDISKIFYTSLTATADNITDISYLKQLFVDLTEGKTGEYKSYLTAVDNTNSIRPNDEVTRAEFAKMLADSGVVVIVAGSEKYKTFKDYEEIPSYARDAVSALSDKNILQTFPDGEFKPNNPVLIEDAIEMIAKASTYMSNNKLIVNTPTFLYTSTLIDDEKEITPKKDYVMELIRQNVIAKYEFKPDKYMLRREAVEIINALTFRGPYVENEVESLIKYKDLKEQTSYYYNMLAAANSYKYKYNHNLWTEIITVNK